MPLTPLRRHEPPPFHVIGYGIGLRMECLYRTFLPQSSSLLSHRLRFKIPRKDCSFHYGCSAQGPPTALRSGKVSCFFQGVWRSASNHTLEIFCYRGLDGRRQDHCGTLWTKMWTRGGGIVWASRKQSNSDRGLCAPQEAAEQMVDQ